VELLRPARDRRHQQHLIAVLERIRRTAQKAYVFLIHINIQEPPRLSRFIPQMGLQVGNCESSSENSSLRLAGEQTTRAFQR